MAVHPCPRCKRLIPVGVPYCPDCKPIAEAQSTEAIESGQAYTGFETCADYAEKRKNEYSLREIA